MKKTIFLFLDGVGIGADSPQNPFFALPARQLPFFHSGMRLPDGTAVAAIDSSAGLPGVPQSATCQTALFTGVSGRRLGPRHIQGYPNRRLRRLAGGSGNIFRLLAARGKSTIFLNAYPFHAPLFNHDHIRIADNGSLHFSAEFPPRFRRLISVTTCLLLSSGQQPLDEADIRARRALYQDYTNASLIQRGADLPRFSPEEAAEVIFQVAATVDFTLYEYFQTDLYGHRRSFDEARDLISGLDRLVARLLARLDRRRDTLILTSDHGNIEDFNSRGHSLHPVPLLVWGRLADALVARIRSIADVTPAIVEILGSEK